MALVLIESTKISIYLVYICQPGAKRSSQVNINEISTVIIK